MSDIFLTFGKNNKNEYVGIEAVEKGKTDLVCPFCEQALVAKKGKIKAHHFAHHKQTCLVSESAIKNTSIPLFDTFDVLDAHEMKYLDRKMRYDTVFPFNGMDDAIERLHTMGILSLKLIEAGWEQAVRERLMAIDESLICNNDISPKLIQILDALKPFARTDGKNLRSQAKKEIVINDVFKEYRVNFKRKRNPTYLLEAQDFWLDALYKKTQVHHPDFMDLLNARLDKINNQSLYVFSFLLKRNNEDEVHRVYKIGMTTRPASERLLEVKSAISTYATIEKSEVICEVKNLGRIERALHKANEPQRFKIGKFTEFYNDCSGLKRVIREIKSLKKVGVKPFIFDGILNPEPESDCNKDSNSKHHRKKTTNDLLKEYDDVVESLKSGHSIRQTSKTTKRAINTVRKVKKALDKIDHSDNS